MPACEYCEAFVSRQYVRVFAPQGQQTVRTCPNCPELLREHGEIRESTAHQHRSRLEAGRTDD